MINLKQYLTRQQRRINEALTSYLPDRKTVPAELYRAMVYSLKSGGKRLRPILTLAAGEMLGARESNLLPAACAVEFIHTYSLIHDDLPAMDNDDLRRGKPTSHKIFGEAVAILAGDALLTQAFEVIATRISDAALAQRLTAELSSAAGARGMVGGQVRDLHFGAATSSRYPANYGKRHTKMLLLKTAALIKAAVCCGAIMARANRRQLSALETYGWNFGLAFQLRDDTLDDPDRKTEPCLTRARKLIIRAKLALKPFGFKAGYLEALADYVVNRTY